MSSDGAALLLRATDRRLHLLDRLGACCDDHRNPGLIWHTVPELVAQRVYGLALGYEDLSDHDQLRDDPMLRPLFFLPLADAGLNKSTPGAFSALDTNLSSSSSASSHARSRIRTRPRCPRSLMFCSRS